MSNNVQNDLRYMEFRFGEQKFALPLLAVKEVIPKPETTPVPNMPSHFEGMINLRGQVLGIYNIRRKLGIPVAQASVNVRHEVVIIVENNTGLVGFIVDEVTRVIQTTPESFLEAPKSDVASAQFVSSIIKSEEDLIMAVEIGKILGFEQELNTKKVA